MQAQAKYLINTALCLDIMHSALVQMKFTRTFYCFSSYFPLWLWIISIVLPASINCCTCELELPSESRQLQQLNLAGDCLGQPVPCEVCLEVDIFKLRAEQLRRYWDAVTQFKFFVSHSLMFHVYTILLLHFYNTSPPPHPTFIYVCFFSGRGGGGNPPLTTKQKPFFPSK